MSNESFRGVAVGRESTSTDCIDRELTGWLSRTSDRATDFECCSRNTRMADRRHTGTMQLMAAVVLAAACGSAAAHDITLWPEQKEKDIKLNVLRRPG
jgi:hypothetical protein